VHVACGLSQFAVNNKKRLTGTSGSSPPDLVPSEPKMNLEFSTDYTMGSYIHKRVTGLSSLTNKQKKNLTLWGLLVLVLR
jgi:hypothetical protein